MKELFFACLRYELTGEPIPDEITIEKEMYPKFLALAQKQDLGHLIADALGKANRLPANIAPAFRKEQYAAVMRTTRMEHELTSIQKCLSDAKIDFIPLKGAVMRNIYPEAWMRTSCDIDILVKRENLDAAVEALKKNLKYTTDGVVDFHDISLYSPSGVHLELHHNICEGMEEADPVLMRVWDQTIPTELPHCFHMTEEFFAFHIVAHMAYHFSAGGAGVRPLMDLWLLAQRKGFSEPVVKHLCKEAGLLPFYTEMRRIAFVILSQDKGDDFTDSVTDFLLQAGIYGTVENQVAIETAKTGNSFSSFMKTVFPPASQMKITYPVLAKKSFLLPFYYIKRIITKLKQGKAASAAAKLKKAVNPDEEKQAALGAIIKRLEL